MKFSVSLTELESMLAALPKRMRKDETLVLSAALGKQVCSTGAVNGRETHGNLYTVISAPSGFGKAVANVAARPFTDANSEMIARYEQEERPTHRADVAGAEALHKKMLGELKGDKLTATSRAEPKQSSQKTSASSSAGSACLLLYPAGSSERFGCRECQRLTYESRRNQRKKFWELCDKHDDYVEPAHLKYRPAQGRQAKARRERLLGMAESGASYGDALIARMLRR